MKWILLVVGVLAALVALVAVIGAVLPKGHVATRSAKFHQPPEVIWQALTDVEAFPSWRPDVRRVERLPDRDGRRAWREVWKNGQVIAMETVELEPPRRLVGRIADPNLPFGGTWTYELHPAEGGTVLRITENGEIYNPIFRFMARFVFGYHATMEQYLKALGKKFSEDVHIGG